MTDIDLVTAWSMWLHAQSLAGYSLWGVAILWWGRFGQIVQLLSGLTILAEIIGAHRLKDFGRTLHTGIRRDMLSRMVQDAIQYRKEFRDTLRGRSNLKEYERFSGWFPGIELLISVVIMGIAIQLAFHWWWLTVPLAPLVIGPFLNYVAPYLMTAVVRLAMLVGVAIDFVVIKPVAWLVDLAAIDRVVKVGSVVSLLIGFHFSLLAS